jgi:hypothetical protein
MIEHTFIVDWRHIALPIVLTTMTAGVVGWIAFSTYS